MKIRQFISISIRNNYIPGMSIESINILVVGAAIASAAGIVGAFAVLKRMTLAGDVLSHVALPGIGIALLFNFSTFLGASVSLLMAAVLVWAIRNRTTLPEETIIGILFSLALAIGVIITASEELIDALFGDVNAVSFAEGVLVIGLSAVIIIVMLLLSKKIVLSTVSPELAKASGLRPDILELIFLLVFATVIALGVRFTGTLLMGALIIVPAAAAKNISRNLATYLTLSVFFAFISTVGGFLFSKYLGILPGPTAIFISTLLFAVSMPFRWR